MKLIVNVPTGSQDDLALYLGEVVLKKINDGFTSGIDGNDTWKLEKSE